MHPPKTFKSGGGVKVLYLKGKRLNIGGQIPLSVIILSHNNNLYFAADCASILFNEMS